MDEQDAQKFELMLLRFESRMRETVRAEIERELRPLRDAIGEVNDEKTGGTGLAGELARTTSNVNQLFAIRNIGVGVFMAVGLAGALLLLGVKAWVLDLVHR